MSKLSRHKFEEDSLNFESLNFKKHLENYKQKMKLIINKMEKDKKEIEEGIEPV